jgi:hypothetical protein
MNPPSEQLIRDYLNRLSVAAKTRLEPRDRQALLDDTRARIETETGMSKATAAQVRRILAALGDPITVAENERARIAAPRDPAAGSRATGSIRQIWPPPGVLGVGYLPALPPAPRQPLPPATMLPLPPATPNLPVAASGAASPNNRSSGSESVPPAPSGLSRLAEPANSADPSGPAGASGRGGPPGSGSRSPRAPRGLPSQRAPRGLPAPGVPRGVPPPRESPAPSNSPPAAPGNSPPASPPPAPGNSPPASPPPASFQPGNSPAPGNSDAPSGEPASPAGQPDPDKAGQKATPGQDGTGHGRLDDEDEPGVEPNIELMEPVVYEEAGPSWLSQRAGAAAGWLARFGSALIAVAARDPLEMIAVLTLGIGAAIYPPIWLVGALTTVMSRNWDLRDKWFGLGMPVLVVIFGTTLTIVLGGQHASFGSYALEAWLAAGRLSRIAAVLSAIYLLWRVYKGPREPKRPPWSMPRKPG